MRGAVFDLDGTLLAGTSAERLLVPFLVRRGVIGVRPLVTAAARAALLPFLGRTRALRRNKLWLGGVEVSAVEPTLPEFVSEVLEPRWNPRVVARLEALRADGVRIHLLTGAPDFLGEAVGRRWSMDGVVATGMEVVAGCFTGRILGAHRFALAKREALATLVAENGLDLRRSWGFADHVSDVPFLEAFAHPVAVEPDAALRRVARSRGWEVLGA